MEEHDDEKTMLLSHTVATNPKILFSTIKKILQPTDNIRTSFFIIFHSPLLRTVFQLSSHTSLQLLSHPSVLDQYLNFSNLLLSPTPLLKIILTSEISGNSL